jgi:hypothetical protein
MPINIPISELDVIYLSYDEPQKEKFWIQIREMVPWAKRVDGVKGSDAAHKAAANASETERFVVIDGDNLPDPDFFTKTLVLDETTKDVQFRWRARNHINGLYYGNGGISCWTKTHVLNMRTHENSDGNDETLIEFCFDKNYWAMHDCYSVTYPNYSPKQAWRAGFREGVKLCTRSGAPPNNIQDFKNWVWSRNLHNLLIWQTIGRDVENGFWAILGARLGTYYLMLKKWDYSKVQDFDSLDKLWDLHKNDDEYIAKNLLQELNRNLELSIVDLDSIQSTFFKNYMQRGWRNRNLMVKEIDVIKEEKMI